MLTDEMIKESLEVKWRKRNMKAVLFVIVFLFFVVLGSCVMNDAPFAIGFCVFLLYFLVISGFIVYEWIYYRLMFKQKEEYVLQEVVLGYPEVSYFPRGYDYFTIQITKKDGDTFYYKTSAMWSDYIGAKNKTWEYANEKITVAYNEDRDKLIVLGKIRCQEDTFERNY